MDSHEDITSLGEATTKFVFSQDFIVVVYGKDRSRRMRRGIFVRESNFRLKRVTCLHLLHGCL